MKMVAAYHFSRNNSLGYDIKKIIVLLKNMTLEEIVNVLNNRETWKEMMNQEEEQNKAGGDELTEEENVL